MNLINISMEQDEILRHLSTPTDDYVAHSIAVSDMPELSWYKIASLGFGFEKDKGNTHAESENELLDSAVRTGCGLTTVISELLTINPEYWEKTLKIHSS